jgi:23S rRNA (adenine1618-N6)-methyltransferase
MTKNKQTKTLHPNNFHNERYDFKQLINSYSDLEEFVTINKYDDLSIDFSNPQAVLALNKALLAHFYGIKNWEIPEKYLCPPIPGRADYVHYLADVLAGANNNKVPMGNKIVGLDIGMGANCIYPIIGNSVYGWNFVGSDIDEIAINCANNLIKSNESLDGNINTKLQSNSSDILSGIINKNDKYDFTICNPPFHKSEQEATQGSKRKVQNLTNKSVKKPTLNFGGQSNELWCKGGEVSFIKTMIKESILCKDNCFWFTTLVSKKENLREIYKSLKSVKPFVIKTIEMKQGQKISRFIAWTFLNKREQKQWIANRWQDKK